MNPMPRALSCPGILLTVAILSAGGAAGQKTQGPPAPPEKLTIDNHRGRGAPMPIKGYDRHVAYLVNAVSVKGKRWERLVRVVSPHHGAIRFPTLKKGEIVPIFGALYRVESASPLGLARLKPEGAPKGVAVMRDSFVIPLIRDEAGSGQIVSRSAKDEYVPKTVFVTAILARVKGGPVARIRIDDIRNKDQEVSRGDVLKLGETEWTVRAVMPADATRGVLGWLELGPRPKKAGGR